MVIPAEQGDADVYTTYSSDRVIPYDRGQMNYLPFRSSASLSSPPINTNINKYLHMLRYESIKLALKLAMQETNFLTHCADSDHDRLTSRQPTHLPLINSSTQSVHSTISHHPFDQPIVLFAVPLNARNVSTHMHRSLPVCQRVSIPSSCHSRPAYIYAQSECARMYGITSTESRSPLKTGVYS